MVKDSKCTQKYGKVEYPTPQFHNRDLDSCDQPLRTQTSGGEPFFSATSREAMISDSQLKNKDQPGVFARVVDHLWHLKSRFKKLGMNHSGVDHSSVFGI